MSVDFNNLEDEQLFEQYENELDSQINFEHYISKNEYKQILREENKIKIIKKVHIKFKDGNSRTFILSKTIPIN